jgi:tight adherence protein B
MPVMAVLFTLLLLFATGGGLFLTLVHVRRARRELEMHIAPVVAVRGGTARQEAELARLQTLTWHMVLAARLRRWFTFGLAHTWGMHAGVLPICLLACFGASAAWLLLRMTLHFSLAFSLAVTFAAFCLAPRAWLKHQQSGAEQHFLTLFPDTIDMVIRMLRAGLPVTAAIRSVGNESAPPVNTVFAQIADQMAIGISFEDALAAAGEQIGLSDFRFFAVAISLQRATGGNLATTLDILSDVMRRRRAMRLKARAVTGEVRMSAYVLGAMPFLVIGGLVVMSPDYLRPLITDRRGNIIVGIAVVSMVVGFATIRQMMRSVTQV